MNKNQYRIIFNASRGCLMAVAETAQAQGKAASGQRRATGSAAGRSPLATSVSALQLACWLATGALIWGASLLQGVHAQTVATRIVADPSAPRSQQATILRTGNGVIQVNIQTPTAAGVSRNAYTQFDVGAQGAILNNSRTSAPTQQGGWVQGNPWLATGSARVILNEVHSNNPSQLQGYVEVAGQRAEVIIANPAGIAVNGGGFLNASGVTLTTGNPLINANTGALESYRVQGGAVRIEGLGLDTSGADYTALLTRALQVNAGVWARHLQVVTGANTVDAASLASGSGPSVTRGSAGADAPTVAIDVAQLGGMYAGKIHLIGTEAGLGVHNAGSIQAGSGPLSLTVDGWLSNSGSIQSAHDQRLATQGRIDNTGVVYAGGQLDVSTPGAIAQTGQGAIMAAQSHATFTAATLSTSRGTAIGSGIRSDGTLADSGDLTINTTQGLQLQGQTVAGGMFRLAASSVDLTGAQISAGQIDIRATSGDITTRQATISAVNKTGQLKLTTGDNAHLDNTQGLISGAQVQVSTGQLDNTQGNITGQSLDIDTHQHGLINTQGTLLASQAAALSTGVLNNQAGLIQSGAALTIDTHGQAFDNSRAAQYPGNAQLEGKGQGGVFAQGSLTVRTGQLNNEAGYMASKGALAIDSASTTNTGQGQILGLADIRVSTTGTLDNTQGLIRGGAKTELNAQEVRNAQTLSSSDAVQTGIEGQNVAISTASLQNNQGAVRAGQDVTVFSGGQINNNAGLISAGKNVTLKDSAALQGGAPTLAISNTEGVVIADKAVRIESQRLSGDGQVLSKGDLSVALASDFVNTGKVVANGNLSLQVANLDNSASVQAGQRLLVRSADINNQASGQLTAQTTQLQATGTLTNRGLIDGNDTLIDAATLNNIGTGRIYGDRLSIGVNTLLNDSEATGQGSAAAVIAARERLDIGAKTITNREGALIFSAGDLHIGGQLDANRHATGQAETLNNNSATIEALGNLTLNVATLNNTNEHFASELRPYGTPENRFYIQPQGNTQRYLSSAFVPNQGRYLLTYSWAVNHDGPPELGKTPMPTPGQLTCTGEGEAEVCQVISGTEYERTHPAWAYFNITAPTEEPVAPTLARPVEPTLAAPQDPSGSDICKVGAATYSASACSTARSQYTTDKAAYDSAWASYNASKATYDAAWAKYDTDHTKWEEDLTVAYDLLGAAITKYNAGFQTGSFANWTQYDLVRSYEKSVITQSEPGKILAGGNMSITGQSLLNDKSQIVAGGSLRGDLDNLTNKDGEGQFLTHEDGTSVYHGTRRVRRWFKRITTDSWSGASPYHDTVTQTITLPVVKALGDASVEGSNTKLADAVKSSVNANTTGPAQASARNAAKVQTTSADTKLPTNSLYTTRPDTQAKYLIETDPQYAGYKTWLGSDYMLHNLNLNPNTAQKRLGDGAYEQKLIRDQVLALTGKRFLGDYQNDEQQFMALMNSGVTVAQKLNLRPGIALTAEQVAQLTSDMVWLVEKTVTLADGSTQRVLAPQVYVRVRDGDLDSAGSLMGGNDVNLAIKGDLTNSGTIAGRRVMEINAQNIQNLGGRLSGEDVSVSASQDINNVGGTIEAQNSLDVSAGRDLNVVTTTSTTDSTVASAPRSLFRRSAPSNSFSNTSVDRVAGLYVKSETGTLLASAGRDMNLVAAAVSSAGNADLQAGNNLNMGTVTTASSQNINWGAGNYLRQNGSQDVGSQVQTGGSLNVQAQQDLNLKAASVSAGQALTASAGQDVNIEEGQDKQSLEEARKSVSRGYFSKKTTITQTFSASTTAVGTNLDGQSVEVTAGNDIKVRGSSVVADQDVGIQAAGKVQLEAAQETSTSQSYSKTTKSGLMGGGGLGVTLGTRSQSVDSKGTGTSAAASTVGSTGGDVSIQAGTSYTQTGSQVLTPKGNIDIQAQKIDIVEARETGSQSTEQKFKQSGITVAVTSPVISAMQTIDRQVEAASHTSSGRMQALAAANVAMNAMQAADAVTKGQAKPDGNAADKAGGVGISVSVGASSSTSKNQSSADSAKASEVSAAGNVALAATGAGLSSDLTVRGSDIKAGGTTTLKADDAVSIVAAQNTTTESNSSKSSSGSIGIGMQFGSGSGSQAGVTVSASVSRGQGAGNSTTYSNSHITADQVSLQSGGDATVKGGVIKAEQVSAQVGGNLTVASLQDSNTYKESGKSAGGSVTFGPSPGGSLNLGATKIDSNYLSVTEQSAIRAGDGGFQVGVQGKTELTGGQITSTQAAIDNNRNSYQAQGGTSTTDLQNSASYSAKSVSVGLGAGSPAPGQSLSAGMSGVGFGSDKGSAQSTTTAGISAVAGDTAARTGDKETGLGQIFNKQQVQQEVAAQVAITQEFGKQASKAVGDYAGSQLRDLNSKANAETDPDKKATLQAEAAKWEEGGSARVALHTVIGGLTGGVAGAVGAGAASAAAPALDELQGKLQQGLQKAGLGDDASKVIASLASGATAAGIGAAAGGGSVAGAATAFNADMNNRQLSQPERQKAAQLAQQSGGKYTQKQIEDAMRSSPNKVKGETTASGMVVSTSDGNGVHDKGAVFTSGEPGTNTIVQQLPNQGRVDASLAEYIKAGTGGVNSPYDWNDAQLGKVQPTYPDPNATIKMQVAPGWNYMGSNSAGIPTGTAEIPRPDYVTVQGGALGVSAGASINLHNGEVFIGGSKSTISSGAGGSVTLGRMLDAPPENVTRGEAVSNMLGGASAQTGVCVGGICGGINQSIGEAGKRPTAIEVGIGTPGASLGVGASVPITLPNK